jgi:prepilin-type N-terminal cleavage/methylation domain-containing protein
MCKHRNSRGFTLVEVVIATFIVGIMSCGIYGLTGTLVRLNAFSDQISRATVLAQNKIEELRGLPSDQIVPGTDSVDIFARNWAVATRGESDPLLLTVTVDWQKVGSNRSQLSLKTMISR